MVGGADIESVESLRARVIAVGTVAMLFARDADASLIPDAGKVAAVKAAIQAELRDLRSTCPRS